MNLDSQDPIYGLPDENGLIIDGPPLPRNGVNEDARRTPNYFGHCASLFTSPRLYLVAMTIITICLSVATVSSALAFASKPLQFRGNFVGGGGADGLYRGGNGGPGATLPRKEFSEFHGSAEGGSGGEGGLFGGNGGAGLAASATSFLVTGPIIGGDGGGGIIGGDGGPGLVLMDV